MSGNTDTLPLPPLSALLLQAEREIGHGCLLAEVALLALVHEHPGYSVAELAKALGTHKPRITRAGDTLVLAGLLHRSIDPDDRRRVRMTLTKAGEQALRRIVGNAWGAAQAQAKAAA